VELKATDIEQVVKAVLASMGQTSPTSNEPVAADLASGIFTELDDAVAAARVAQKALHSVAMRQLVIAAIRGAGEAHARELAELAVTETGMGRVDDKIAKIWPKPGIPRAWSACRRRY
jgi:aldehyde dehydrogenase